VQVWAIVRSADRLPAGAVGHPGLKVVEADLLSLSSAELAALVQDRDAVVSCLGHSVSLKGVFGAPRDLVTQAVKRLCQAIHEKRPIVPVKFVLMSSVSVNHPAEAEQRRGAVQKAVLWVLRALVPPAKDNQEAADFLVRDVGDNDHHVQWVAVRPDTLREGDISDYLLHDTIVSSLFRPDRTNMANVAHFMCELVTESKTWNRWKGGLPVLTNSPAGSDRLMRDA
jgi:hypothetical protein